MSDVGIVAQLRNYEKTLWELDREHGGSISGVRRSCRL